MRTHPPADSHGHCTGGSTRQGISDEKPHANKSRAPVRILPRLTAAHTARVQLRYTVSLGGEEVWLKPVTLDRPYKTSPTMVQKETKDDQSGV